MSEISKETHFPQKVEWMSSALSEPEKSLLLGFEEMETTVETLLLELGAFRKAIGVSLSGSKPTILSSYKARKTLFTPTTCGRSMPIFSHKRPSHR